MTYETYFSLSRRPFSVQPDPSSYLALPRHQQIVATLRDCVEHVEGIGLLVGDSGLGKTLLCRLLIQELAPRLQGVLLAHSNLPSKRALIQAILFELRQPYVAMDEQESRLALLNHLQSRPAMQPALLLVVDEAHGLQTELLEELRLLTNWTRGVKPLVRLVLAGQPILEELLAGPETDLLNRRIARRAYLSPLTEEETARYVDHRLRWAGAEASSVFTAEALSAIHRSADGVPRTLNLLCDQVLALAAGRRSAPVTAAVVKEAWGELEQLPTSWAYSDGASHEPRDDAGVVEFGSDGDAGECASNNPLAEPLVADADAHEIAVAWTAPVGQSADGVMAPDATDPVSSFGTMGEAASREPPGRSNPAAVAPIAETPPVETEADNWVPPEQDTGAAIPIPTTCQPRERPSASRPHFEQAGVSSCAAATLREVATHQPEPETAVIDDWQINPSPIDASFEQEEHVWDQYATLDAQATSESPLADAFTLRFETNETTVGNGAAGSAGNTAPSLPNAAESNGSASLDYRRLFSALRK